jgi:hypothetical protein
MYPSYEAAAEIAADVRILGFARIKTLRVNILYNHNEIGRFKTVQYMDLIYALVHGPLDLHMYRHASHVATFWHTRIMECEC